MGNTKHIAYLFALHEISIDGHWTLHWSGHTHYLTIKMVLQDSVDTDTITECVLTG